MKEPTATEILEHYISVVRQKNEPTAELQIRDLQKTIDALREKDEALTNAKECVHRYSPSVAFRILTLKVLDNAISL